MNIVAGHADRPHLSTDQEPVAQAAADMSRSEWGSGDPRAMIAQYDQMAALAPLALRSPTAA